MQIIDLLTKLIVIFIIFYGIKNKNRFMNNLDKMDLKPIVFFQLVLLLLTLLVDNIFISGMDDTFGLALLLTVIIITLFYFIYVISRIEKLNKDKFSYEKQLQQAQFNKEKLITVKGIKNEIDAIDHRLFYVVFEIDHLLEKKEYDKAQALIDNYKNTILKHKMVVNTNNSVFDCLLSLKINDLLLKDIDVKTCIFISENECYDNLVLINFLTNTFNQLSTSRYIDFDLREIDDFIKIRFLFDSEKMDYVTMNDWLIENAQKIHATYRLKQNDGLHYELGVVLELKDLL